MVSRVLYIDLTNESFEVKDLENFFFLHLGGIGTGIKLLEDNCPDGIDPLAEEAPIILNIGALEAMFPCCNKTVAVFKSPLTGNLGESYAGGKLGLAMRFADYGAIVIKGKAKRWTYLAIRNGEIKFENATTLKGLSTYTTARILREAEKRKGILSTICIGPAGEHLIKFANASVDMYRHFGRLGLGAVMGSKNLKAITVAGSKSFKIEDKSSYETVFKAIYEILVNTPIMQKYHDLGTASNVLPLNELGCFPTKNLKQSHFDYADEISGERFAQDYLTHKTACAQCPVGCIHIATLRIPFAAEHEYESLRVSYDYEPIFSLGSMLGMGSVPDLLRLIETVEAYGLDAMSTGVILAWATEAYENGLISRNETMGVKLGWGDVDGFSKAIENLVVKRNEFYESTGKGVVEASAKYGGEDFALALGKNEIAGYHCGYATILGQLFGGRHSHLDNGGYSLDQKVLKKPMEPEEMVDKLILEEQGRCVFNSLVACLFARGMYTEKIISDALEVAGIKRSIPEMRELGELIFKERLKFKIREGFKFDDLKVPKRFFKTKSPIGLLDENKLNEMSELYRNKLKSI